MIPTAVIGVGQTHHKSLFGDHIGFATEHGGFAAHLGHEVLPPPGSAA